MLPRGDHHGDLRSVQVLRAENVAGARCVWSDAPHWIRLVEGRWQSAFAEGFQFSDGVWIRCQYLGSREITPRAYSIRPRRTKEDEPMSRTRYHGWCDCISHACCMLSHSAWSNTRFVLAWISEWPHSKKWTYILPSRYTSSGYGQRRKANIIMRMYVRMHDGGRSVTSLKVYRPPEKSRAGATRVCVWRLQTYPSRYSTIVRDNWREKMRRFGACVI